MSPSKETNRSLVGNDVVDIDYCELPLYWHVRHLDRVCTPEEAKCIRASADPVRALAVIWAAKEATFKLVSKGSDLGFVPRRFVSEIEGHDPAKIDKKLSIFYAKEQSEVRIFVEDGYVHAAAFCPGTDIMCAVRGLGKREHGADDAMHESKEVRSLAKFLSCELGFAELELEFEGRVPRVRNLTNKRPSIDVSLSHHGRFVAAALAWRAEELPNGELKRVAHQAVWDLEAGCFTCTV